MAPSIATAEIQVHLRTPHRKQMAFTESPAKRIIVRAGRRSGKTVGVAQRSVRRFLEGRRQLYATPTSEQLDSFWFEVKSSLRDVIDAGLLRKNEVEHVIEFPGTKQRIRAKTAWNADSLRGDYADDLMLDEFQLMDENAWELVGAPMLLDNDGDAVFIYTPPSLHSRSVSKARDPKHASKMFRNALKSTTGRWATFHFTSHDNPFISARAIEELAEDMSALAIRQEIMAEDVDEVPGAMWTRELIEKTRIPIMPPHIVRMVIGVDPPGGATECGIVGAALTSDGQVCIYDDRSLRAGPNEWASAVLDLFAASHADKIIGEANFGGDMVRATIENVARIRGMVVPIELVHASRGKAVRAEPVVAMFEHFPARAHIVRSLPGLEDELVSWVPGLSESPNRLDAMVWAVTELTQGATVNARAI